MPSPKDSPLLSLRATVVLFCALIVGASAGGLTYLGSNNVSQAVLAGGAAFGAGVLWLHSIIAD